MLSIGIMRFFKVVAILTRTARFVCGFDTTGRRKSASLTSVSFNSYTITGDF